MLRHPKSNKPILNVAVCTNDFGDMVYECAYTKVLVATKDAIFIGPCVPQVNGTYVCAPDAMPAFRKSKALFDASDANCNTCSKLVRTPQKACPSGIMVGSCHLGEQRFHPEDWMGMDCWTART
jgi:hypothetical protein